MVSRGIAQLFLGPLESRWGGGSAPRPGRLYPRETPGTHCTGGWVGPRGRSGRAENVVSTGIRSRTVQPAVSRYTD